ncbi:MAG TPA: transcriptional repressor LexA [Candidatus Polarisedimenticolia bacterium]|nr:transcriptional repressor LexA [Candidatus Polarisedimenticolia bacterium]
MVLTKRQKQILDFITRFIDQKGYSPSLMEIGEHFGLSSVATVHKHVDNLRKKGLVRKVWNANRSLDLTPAALAVRAVRLPLAGRVAAGQPIEAVEERDVIAVPEDMVGAADAFVLQVKGDSMIDEQIRDGDFVVVEKRQRPPNGSVVVALLDGQEATLKKFYKEGDMVRLQPANSLMKPISVSAERVRVQGVVIGLMRRYR